MSIEIARLLLETFRGRTNWLAYQPQGKHFQPLQLHSPLTPEKFAESHLAGTTSLGFYVLTSSSTCYVSCLDFDNHGDENPLALDQAKQAYNALLDEGFSPIFEISQSGKGSHIWLIFGGEQDAWLVRLFWKTFIEKYCPNTSIEIYPRQDQLTKKKFGNLVRYPLFGQSRFVNSHLSTVDPLERLKTLSRTTGDDLRAFLDKHGVDHSSPSQAVTTHPEASESVIDGYLPERVRTLIESNKNSILSLRWMGQTSGLVDGSYSGILMSLATELVKSYVPTHEIEESLTYWVHLRNYTKAIERPDILEHTIDKAYSMVLDRREKKALTGNTFASLTHQYADAVFHNEDILVPTGVRGIDDSIGGLGFGELGIVSGRPSQGKTAFALQWMDNAASFGFPTLLVSLEMSAGENSKRVLLRLSEGQVDWKTEQGNQYLHQKIDSHFKNRYPMYFLDGVYDIDRIEDAIDHYVKDYGVQFCVIDYQGLATWRETKDEYASQTEITKRLKRIARRNDIAVVSLVQMKRPMNENADREPNLSDLRSSGEIEQSADVVMFCRWPHYEDHTKPINDYVVWQKKCRNRGVKRPKVDLFFDPESQTIR